MIVYATWSYLKLPLNVKTIKQTNKKNPKMLCTMFFTYSTWSVRNVKILEQKNIQNVVKHAASLSGWLHGLTVV